MQQLYKQLIEAYSQGNLNRITGKLIELYRNRNYGEIRGIANKISRYITIDEEQDAKCFSKLVMLYHPDRENLFKNEIDKSYSEKDYQRLRQFSHILLVVEDIDKIKVITIDDDIDYCPEYVWDDVQEDGYSFVDYDSDENYEEFNPEEVEKSFYNALKLREYGTLNVTFPTLFLLDYAEIELAQSGLESLDGIEFCKNVITLDLSGNEITDISDLWNLKQLEELYLANNQIGYVDALCSLKKLRILDLSGNQIDDISPLFNLEDLEYLNLADNKIPKDQIKILTAKGIIVMQ
jgi:hypothetical protein